MPYRVISINTATSAVTQVMTDIAFNTAVTKAKEPYKLACEIAAILPEPTMDDLKTIYKEKNAHLPPFYLTEEAIRKAAEEWRAAMFKNNKIYKTVATDGNIFTVCGGGAVANIYYTFLKRNKEYAKTKYCFDETVSTHAEVKLMGVIGVNHPPAIGVSTTMCSDCVRAMEALRPRSPVFFYDGDLLRGARVLRPSPPSLVYAVEVPFLCEVCHRKASIRRTEVRVNDAKKNLALCESCMNLNFSFDCQLPETPDGRRINESEYKEAAIAGMITKDPVVPMNRFQRVANLLKNESATRESRF